MPETTDAGDRVECGGATYVRLAGKRWSLGIDVVSLRREVSLYPGQRAPDVTLAGTAVCLDARGNRRTVLAPPGSIYVELPESVNL